MLSGKQLGAAIEAARLLKNVPKAAMARHFKVSPPSIQDWVKRGTIDKSRLPELWDYFSDVVGPEHWGLGEGAIPAPQTDKMHAPTSAQQAGLSEESFSLAARVDALKNRDSAAQLYSTLASLLDMYESQERAALRQRARPTKGATPAKRAAPRQHHPTR